MRDPPWREFIGPDLEAIQPVIQPLTSNSKTNIPIMARHTHSQGSKRSAHSSLTQDTENTESILAKFAQAEKLEAQLAAIENDKKAKRKLPAGTDQKAQELRGRLCQVFIDVIVVDPVLSHSKDASRRLWHSCFYSRVSDLRLELSKEKSRAKKRQVSGGDVAGSEKIVSVVNEQLTGSIKEALKLYEWLIDKMLKLLLPMSQSQSTNVSDNSENDDYEHAVVAILYWSHLYKGDLLRYDESYKQAEETYLKSSKLYPGNGNPFNQLAVVAQSQDSLSAVALYYYARSMMATQAPSAMSDSNLQRLFTSNAKWLDEHAREDDSFSRGIFEVNENEGNKTDKKAQRDWQQKQKTAMNRMALAKFVDLQWSFVKGVSLDGAVFRDVIQDMDSMLVIFTKLINNASFSESLLCKIVAILSFATLGASNGGKLCKASMFAKKRRKDPDWKEDAIIANNALAFSFVLRFCTVLIKDIENRLANKGGGKIGTIRSLSSLLLGVSFVNAIYKGSEYFHGLPFYPGKGSSSAVSPNNNRHIRELCEQCHNEFWRSGARLANQLNSFSKPSSEDAATFDLIDVKDFAEFCGYVPFDSFLKHADNHTSGKSKYAPTEEVISVLTQKKSTANKKMDSEMQTKIQLFLLFADVNTALSTVYGYDQSEFYLARNPETNERELYQSSDSVSDQDEDDDFAAAETNFSPDPSPVTDEMEATTQDDDAVMKEVVPLKMTYSETGVALLTPAALLESNKINMPPGLDQVQESEHAMPTLAPPKPEIAQNIFAPAGGIILNVPGQPQQAPIQPTKATLPPPPGLMPPPGFSHQPKMNNVDSMQNNAFVGNMTNFGMAPQTAPVHSLNPFAQVAPSLINDFGASLNQPSHMNANQGLNNNHYHQSLGLGPSMNALFNSNQSLDQLASSDAFGLVLPQQAEPDDQSDSIMKFLFEGNDNSPGKPNSQSANDLSLHTMNPFAK